MTTGGGTEILGNRFRRAFGEQRFGEAGTFARGRGPGGQGHSTPGEHHQFVSYGHGPSHSPPATAPDQQPPYLDMMTITLGDVQNLVDWYNELVRNGTAPPLGAFQRGTDPSTFHGSSDEESVAFQRLKLMKRFARDGNVNEAESLLELLKDDGMISTAHYNYFIQTCAKACDLERAESVVHQMELECGVQPDNVTYNMVINACAQSRAPEAAEKWFHAMRERSIEPTEVTYGTLCKLFGRCGMVDQVVSVMESIEASGAALNEHFFASLILACDNVTPKDTQRAEWALQNLVFRGLSPNRVKKVLERVVGKARTEQLYSNLETTQASLRRPGGAQRHDYGTARRLPEQPSEFQMFPSEGRYRPTERCYQGLVSRDTRHQEDFAQIMGQQVGTVFHL